MVMIPNIQPSVEPQGQIETLRRQLASGEDFGAPQAEAMGQLGRGLGQASNELQQFQETQDVTAVYKNLAQARLDWTKELQQRATQAPAGSDTLVSGLTQDMGAYFAKGGEAAATAKGQQLWATQGANLTSEFGQRAIGVQADLDGKAASNDHAAMMNNLGLAVSTDPTQLKPSLQHLNEALDDPGSIYARIPGPLREQMRKQGADFLNKAMWLGTAERSPQAIFDALGPDLTAKAVAASSQTTVVPGGKLTVGLDTLAQAPAYNAAARQVGLPPGVVMAVADLTAGPGQQEPAALATSLGTLTQTYGNLSEALAAYHMGTAAFDKLLQTSGMNWQGDLPAEVQGFVQDALTKGGLVPAAPSPIGEAPAPAASTVPPPAATLAGIGSYADQEAVMQKAVQVQNMQWGLEAHQRAEQERQKAEASDAAFKGDIVKIINRQFSTGDLRDAATNGLYNAAQYEHLATFNYRWGQEIKNGLENKSNPVAYNNFTKQILAAYQNPNADPKVIDDDVISAQARGELASREAVSLIELNKQFQHDSSFGHLYGNLMAQAGKVFARDPLAYPGSTTAEENQATFSKAVLDKVKEYRDAGKDVNALFDPNNKQEFLGGANITRFMAPPGATLTNLSAKETAKLPLVNSAEDYAAVAPGTYYRTGTGQTLLKKGAVKPAEAPAVQSVNTDALAGLPSGS